MQMQTTWQMPDNRNALARREVARRAQIELARRRLTPFCGYVDPDAKENYEAAHLRYVAKKLEALERGEFRRMMLFMPNRHWKSSLCTMKFPAWFIAKRYLAGEPHQVMLISHTADKAEEFSEYARNLIRDKDSGGKSRFQDVFADVRISRTRQAASEWGLLEKDGYQEEPFPTVKTGSLNAPPTGSGADLLIIDDPIKSSQEARSVATQKLHLKTWEEGLRTRLNGPDAAVLLLMTRWHVGDIAGQLLKTMASDPLADQWEVVVLPALAYTSKERVAARRAGIPLPDSDPLGREPGAALWPAKFPKAFHIATKANGLSSFASIGQQMPIQEGGNMLSREMFRRMDAVPRIDRQTNPHGYIKWVIPIDAAYKEKQLAKDDPDFNVFGLLGFWLPDKRERLNVNIVLASLMRTQQGMTHAKDMGVKFCLAMEKLLGHKPEIVGPADTLDKIILDDLRGHPDMLGWRVRSLDDPLIKRQVGAFTGDKVSKFEPWRDRAQGGRFYVVDEAWSLSALAEAFPRSTRQRLLGAEPLAWHEKFFTEVEAFPDWSHDDMVDMVSVGYHTFSVRPEQGKKKARSMQG